MKLHGNHRTCPRSRLLIRRRVLEGGWTLRQAAEAAGCSVRTAGKWLKRFREGDHELLDRSSRPRRSPTRLPSDRVGAIESLRRLWMTAAEIAEVLRIPLSTVLLWLKRIGLGRRHGRAGAPASPIDFARVVRTALEDRDELARRSRAAAEFALEQLVPEKTVARIESVLADVCRRA
jgi:transposase